MSAIIIVSAVVFGLACGSIVGCLLVRLYSMQQQSPLGRPQDNFLEEHHSPMYETFLCSKFLGLLQLRP